MTDVKNFGEELHAKIKASGLKPHELSGILIAETAHYSALAVVNSGGAILPEDCALMFSEFMVRSLAEIARLQRTKMQ